MQRDQFDAFFSGAARRHLIRAIRDSLLEDETDLTSVAVFPPDAGLKALITAKQESLMTGVYIAPLILEETARLEPGEWSLTAHVREGDLLVPGADALSVEGNARLLLRAERVVLNFITHLSGISNLTRSYVNALKGTGTRLLDTRKTLPGLRYPEKYAVLVGGGCNHRKNLSEMLMLKDNHIDAAGGVEAAVKCLRDAYNPAPPIEVECRTLGEVREAVKCNVSRIMLDNMLDSGGVEVMEQALALVPASIEVEVSGGITLDNIARVAGVGGARKPDYISVGRLTHSAPAADFSMRISV